jgi:glycosyltransferase involved in cell wall biosynthesis
MTQRQTANAAGSPRLSVTGREAVPGVFLMIDSLQTGGSERQFASLARSLDRSSFHLCLGCIQERGGFREGLGEMTQFRLGGSLYGLQSLKTRLRLARHLRQRHVAVAHAFDFYTNLTLVPAARLSRIPVVIGSQRQMGDLLTPRQARAQMAAFRWCDRVVCNSRAAAERLVDQGLKPGKIAVIGNGLSPEAFAKNQPALPRGAGVLRVGMIARMNLRAKNHLIFLRAAARLKARYPTLEILLAGDGPLRPELEGEAARLGLGETARFLGDRRDIPALLASMDISVLPSESESLSNVVLESMAAGVPVVATRVGGNVELIADGRGALVPVGDEEALAAAMAQVLQDPALGIEWGENGRRFALENFSLERMRKRHQELYAELLEEKGWYGSRSQKQSVPRQSPTASRTRPLRVVMVAASMRYVGGHSVQADLLIRSWQHDPAVEASFIPVDPVFPRLLGWLERIPFLRTLIREPIYLASLWKALKHADVAHIFSASYWSFLVAPAPAWLLARIRGAKALINYHSGEARDHLRRSRIAVPVLRRADRLVVPSDYLVDVFHEFGLEARAVPNIVDLERFSFRAREPLRPHLICTRGFHPYYSVDVVVRAFAEVKRIYPGAKLCLVGGGPTEAEIRDLVRELKLEGVYFAGVVSRQEIGRRYDEADIFINGSWLDNMPISILEAFASGTPVVTTGPEGIRYLVEHERTGLLSEPGDWHALAANVIRVLRNGELASHLASNAREESRRYHWEAVREQWLEVYRSVQGREAPGQAARKTGATEQNRQEHIASSRV